MKIINKVYLLCLSGLLMSPQVFAGQMGGGQGHMPKQAPRQMSGQSAGSMNRQMQQQTQMQEHMQNQGTDNNAAGSMSEQMHESQNKMDMNTKNNKTMEMNNASEEMTGFSRGTVARSVFTTTIDNREPVDKLKEVANQDKVFYFTELRDMTGQTAKHRWEYNGKVVAEVKFNVRGPRWRVWSKKTFQPGWSGNWKVSVVNGAGEVISEDVIAYSQNQHMDRGSRSTEMNNASMQQQTEGTGTSPENAAPSGMQTQ